MHQYFIKTPWIVKRLFPSYVWSLPASDNIVYLTFDDGPHPEITPWVLDLLKQYQARATFFCIGHNVEQHPGIYQRILDEGHATGNHTYAHVNGWKTGCDAYMEDVRKGSRLIASNLFRPPYGRITRRQARRIPDALGSENARIIMWDVLSGDFDTARSAEQCYRNIVQYTEPGSILVFHDSTKAFPHLREILPKTMEFLKEKEYMLKKIEL